MSGKFFPQGGKIFFSEAVANFRGQAIEDNKGVAALGKTFGDDIFHTQSIFGGNFNFLRLHPIAVNLNHVILAPDYVEIAIFILIA